MDYNTVCGLLSLTVANGQVVSKSYLFCVAKMVCLHECFNMCKSTGFESIDLPVC